MADIIDSSWNPNDEANTGVAPDGVQGGYAPSTVAPIIRTIRGATKRFYEQINPIYTSTGSANAYVLTYPIAPAKYSKGILYAFWANHTNTGAATLNINGLGAKAITSSDKNALVASQILADTVVTVVYDGSAFRMIAASTVNPKFTGMTTLENLTVTGSTYAKTITATDIVAKDGNVYIDSDASRHLHFRDAAGSTTALVYNHNASNNLYLRSYALTGDTFNEVVLQPDGQLLLPTAPTSTGAATTKSYVDTLAATKLNLSGGALTGALSVTGNLSASGNVAATGVVKASGATLHVDGNVQGTLWGGYLSDYINSRITNNTNGNMNGRAYPRRSDGAALNFMWQGQGGQPTWLWGGNGAGNDMYVYNPANFNVNYANSTWNSERLQGWDIAGIQNDAQNRANARRPLPYTGDWENNTDFPVGSVIGYVCDRNSPPNQHRNIYVGGATAGTGNNFSTFNTGAALLAGIWRHRGISGQQGSTGWWGGVAERVG
ncbi:MAG: hypothetical protein ACODTL_16075 [Brucella sp.]